LKLRAPSYLEIPVCTPLLLGPETRSRNRGQRRSNPKVPAAAAKGALEEPVFTAAPRGLGAMADKASKGGAELAARRFDYKAVSGGALTVGRARLTSTMPCWQSTFARQGWHPLALAASLASALAASPAACTTVLLAHHLFAPPRTCMQPMAVNGPAADRKRRAVAMEAIPEAKRAAGSGGAKPARSAPAPPPAAPATSGAAPSFQSEGNNRPAGPAPGEETFEELHERTGLSMTVRCGRVLHRARHVHQLGATQHSSAARLLAPPPPQQQQKKVQPSHQPAISLPSGSALPSALPSGFPSGFPSGLPFSSTSPFNLPVQIGCPFNKFSQPPPLPPPPFSPARCSRLLGAPAC
jgi:hypothetical protein